ASALTLGMPSLPGAPTRSFLRLHDVDGATVPLEPASADRPARPRRAGRHDLLGEVARGGMGVVYRGRDPDLGRDLAVNVLHADRRGDPAVRQRFVEEARIAGQLQHPGVVPVHELGQLPDGRPYFTMELVKGRTLAALLAERPSPLHELPRFLGVF